MLAAELQKSHALSCRASSSMQCWGASLVGLQAIDRTMFISHTSAQLSSSLAVLFSQVQGIRGRVTHGRSSMC